jgi:hypothetical protein
VNWDLPAFPLQLEWFGLLIPAVGAGVESKVDEILIYLNMPTTPSQSLTSQSLTSQSLTSHLLAICTSTIRLTRKPGTIYMLPFPKNQFQWNLRPEWVSQDGVGEPSDIDTDERICTISNFFLEKELYKFTSSTEGFETLL